MAKILNSFEVEREPSETWALLLDVPAIVPCVPGAELLEDRGNGEYVGLASVKIGPIQLQFRGTVVIAERDDKNYVVRLFAKGADRKGRGSAHAASVFHLSSKDGGTQVNVETDLDLAGTVAQYGRAEGLIQSIASEIVRTFADNLRALLSGTEVSEETRPISAISLGAKVLKSRLFGK